MIHWIKINNYTLPSKSGGRALSDSFSSFEWRNLLLVLHRLCSLRPRNVRHPSRSMFLITGCTQNRDGIFLGRARISNHRLWLWLPIKRSSYRKHVHQLTLPNLESLQVTGMVLPSALRTLASCTSVAPVLRCAGAAVLAEHLWFLPGNEIQ